MAKMKAPRGGGDSKEKSRPPFPKSGKDPLAPPGLAPKMRGLAGMPRMMRKGGKVRGK